MSVLARRGVLEREDAGAMGTWDHGEGFSLDASVRIEADDRLGLERLLRYRTWPAFALERLREIDAVRLVYASVKPGAGGSVSRMLDPPLELIERLAAPNPPPGRRAAEPQEAAIRMSGPRRALLGRQPAIDLFEAAARYENADFRHGKYWVTAIPPTPASGANIPIFSMKPDSRRSNAQRL